MLMYMPLMCNYMRKFLLLFLILILGNVPDAPKQIAEFVKKFSKSNISAYEPGINLAFY